MLKKSIGAYDKVLAFILDDLPIHSSFIVDDYIQRISDIEFKKLVRKIRWVKGRGLIWHYQFASRGNVLGLPSASDKITDFLLSNDFAIEVDVLMVPIPRHKSIKLTPEGVALKKAKSYKRYIRRSKLEYDAVVRENWKKKHWFILSVLGFLIGFFFGFFTDIGKQYILERYQQLEKSKIQSR